MSTSGETIPRVGYLLRVLFERTWEHLDASYAKTSEFAFPGVYVLAYSNEQLKGRVIKETDVFYVGVTHAGIRKRLRQFRAGLEYGKHHSGAKRFFIKIAGRTPYSELLDKKIFYVASVSARCNCLKPERSPTDLRTMGVVAELEWYVLARIKERTNREPWLNKK